MAKTILITGSSSGFGKLTAELFQKKGWNVAATMRSPEKESDLRTLPSVKVYELDVTKSDTVKSAVAAIIDDFGSIDVLVNNAGFGTLGALEAATIEVVRKQLDTNVIGVIETTKAVLPQMRKQRSGVIINVSSVAGRIGLPFNTLYNTSKFAVEGLTESLQYEAGLSGVRVKLIEPTGFKTDFGSRSLANFGIDGIQDYEEAYGKFLNGFEDHFSDDVQAVADIIYTAAVDESEQLRYPVGAGGQEYLEARRTMDDVSFKTMVKNMVGI